MTMTSRSAALRLGHQGSKVRNVVVNNLVIKDTNRGFAIFSASNVRAESENGIRAIGQQNNIRDVELRDWSLTLRYGRNRPLFKPLCELWPMPAVPAPDPKPQIPWLYAADVQGLQVAKVRSARADGEADFNIDPVTGGGDQLEFSAARSGGSDALLPPKAACGRGDGSYHGESETWVSVFLRKAT